jgi:hypothetical protein
LLSIDKTIFLGKSKFTLSDDLNMISGKRVNRVGLAVNKLSGAFENPK